MTDLTLNSLVGGGGELKLAPDVGGLAARSRPDLNYTQVAGIDGSSGLVTALSLTGKYAISLLLFSSMNAEAFTCKLTVDGEVIYNDTDTIYTSSASGLWCIFGRGGAVTASSNLNSYPWNASTMSHFVCESSLLLEIQSTTDTSINLLYKAKPIL